MTRLHHSHSSVSPVELCIVSCRAEGRRIYQNTMPHPGAMPVLSRTASGAPLPAGNNRQQPLKTGNAGFYRPSIGQSVHSNTPLWANPAHSQPRHSSPSAHAAAACGLGGQPGVLSRRTPGFYPFSSPPSYLSSSRCSFPPSKFTSNSARPGNRKVQQPCSGRPLLVSPRTRPPQARLRRAQPQQLLYCTGVSRHRNRWASG